jgi:ferredoxin
MCEFCTKHGEGQKWYLQMKNYTADLLHAELTTSQQQITAANTRLEWNQRFWQGFVMPAITGVPRQHDIQPFAGETQDQSKVEHFGQVLPIEDVEAVLDMVDSITRMPCGCRYLNIGKTDKRYCFGFGFDRLGILGAFPDAASSLEVLSKQEARRLFRAYDDEGLMHSIWTGVTPYVVGMCNCDRDCGAYRGYLHGSQDFFRAEYICRVDWDACNGCKTCMSQCQFGAQGYSSALGKVYIDPARCYGCGVCRASCPNDAIALTPRHADPVATKLWLSGAVSEGRSSPED